MPFILGYPILQELGAEFQWYPHDQASVTFHVENKEYVVKLLETPVGFD